MATKKKDLTLESIQTQLSQEKSGKRKIFHSLVKVANELRRTRTTTQPILNVHAQHTNNWYSSGLIVSTPKLLPGVHLTNSSSTSSSSTAALGYNAMQTLPIFFYIVMVSSLCHNNNNTNTITNYCILYNILFKEIHYSTRFDTSDIVGQVVLLVLTMAGGLLSYFSIFGAAVCAVLVLLLLQIRTVLTFYHGGSEDALTQQIVKYASVEIVLLLLEGGVWMYKLLSESSKCPPYVTFIGILLGWRLPAAILSHDFLQYQNACKAIYCLLIGVITSQLAHIGSEFILDSEPTLSQSLLMISSMVLLFGILILVLDDSDTTAADHAMSVNSFCGFLFYVCQLLLWFLTIHLGQGLQTVWHNVLVASSGYLDSTAQAQYTVVGAYAGLLLCLLVQSTLHVRRVPGDKQQLFKSLFLLQGLCTAAVIGLALAVYSGWNVLFFVFDDPLVFVGSLAVSVIVLIWIGWLDYLVELIVYRTKEERAAALTEPLGFWWCVKPKRVEEELDASSESTSKLESLTPLLGGDKTTDDLNYQSVDTSASIEV